jgi:hypothetical protein
VPDRKKIGLVENVPVLSCIILQVVFTLVANFNMFVIMCTFGFFNDMT